MFLGRFHPLLVHLPIGGLVLLGFLELLARSTRWKQAAQNRRLMLGFVCTTAAASAGCGWLLAQEGGYDAQLLTWHRAAGLGVCGACLAAFLLDELQRRRAYWLTLWMTIALLTFASHLGGSLTHGREFLGGETFAPRPVLLAHGRGQETRTGAGVPLMQQPVFAGVIEPILRRRCVACHSATKHKADLRLDTFEALLQGGQNGPVLKPGQAKDSSLIQRMLVPLDGDGHMPPEDEPQATAEEIALLEWWVNSGALADEKLADLKPAPQIRRLLQIVSRREESARE